MSRKIREDLDLQDAQKVVNAVDGVDPQDYATLAQIGFAVPDPSGEPDGKVLTTASGALVYASGGGGGGGAELDYAEITSNVTITGTTDAGATTVITGSAVSYDGSTRIKLEYFLGASLNAGSEIVVVVYDGTTDLGRCSFASNQGSSVIDAWVPGAMFLTPAAGTRTFSIRAWKVGTVSVYAGSGGAGTTMPAWFRITEA